LRVTSIVEVPLERAQPRVEKEAHHEPYVRGATQKGKTMAFLKDDGTMDCQQTFLEYQQKT